MQLVINGEPMELPHVMNVAELAEYLQLDTRIAAIERNQAIVPKSLYADTQVEAGDTIEIVGFIGGG